MRPGSILAIFDHGIVVRPSLWYLSTRAWSFNSSCSVQSPGLRTSGERWLSHLRAYVQRKLGRLGADETRPSASVWRRWERELRRAGGRAGVTPFSALLAGPVNVEDSGERGPLLWPLVLHKLYQALVVVLPPQVVSSFI